MSIFRTHILIPVDEGTVQAGVLEVKRQLEKQLRDRNLDQEIKVLETGTVGIVGQGVILVVFPERVYYTRVKLGDIGKIVEEHLIKGRVVKEIEHFTLDLKSGLKDLQPLGPTRKQTRIVLDKSWRIDPENIEEVLAAGGYRGIEKILSSRLSPEQVIDEIKKSGLRGRGGAGFPTGTKWEFTRKAPGEEKYVICNADEGEPGTFKDRLILEGDPHKLIEGMLIAGYAVGASKGFVYIRGEYALSIERLEKAIGQARQYGLLGDNILESKFSFDITVMKGAGAYVCGEETALIESLEGKRGHPRNKPPYPVTEGLWAKPTVVNNVETLANVPEIILHGASWFRGYGTEKCPGTKVFTIIGNVTTPGLIEVEMGTTLRDIIYEYAGGIKNGKQFKGALVGGAAGAFLGPDMLDVKMDFVNLKEYSAVLGSGAILVMDEDVDMLDMLKSVLHFFRHESCGHCVPCRLGTAQLVKIIDRMSSSKGRKDDIDKLMNIARVMQATSFCPLGQSLYLPISSSLKYFGDEIRSRARQ